MALAWRCSGFLAQKLIQRTELSSSTKLSSGDETPPINNVLLAVGFIYIEKCQMVESQMENQF
jgi:hypothetical protein